MLLGSAIATSSVEPARCTGIAACLLAIAFGTRPITFGSISKSVRFIQGTPYCSDRKSASSRSPRMPRRARLYDSRLPVVR
jgi:hypothetical protein